MNLRAGWAAAGAITPRRPLFEALAEVPPPRGRRRLCTHMRPQYDAEVIAAIQGRRVPDLRDRQLPSGRSPGTAAWFRNESRPPCRRRNRYETAPKVSE